MQTTMTLFKIVQELDILDTNSTIYAAKPWTENSIALVLPEQESGELPPEAKRLGLSYFLEVFIAHDFLFDWAANANHKSTTQQLCARLIKYATKDA